MVIDANMYWFPEEIFSDEGLMRKFLSELPRGYGVNGYETATPDGKKQIVIEKPTGYQNLNYIQDEYILEKQLADMDAADVDKAVLKIPCCHEWMSLDMCRIFNDGMAEHAGKSGGRMSALASVPPWGDAGSLTELERCKLELGMNGVQLSAHYGNLYLDDKIFEPFLSKLNEFEMTAYIHHTPVPVQYDALYEYNNLRRSYGRCADQTTAIGRELFGGIFGKYPKLKFVHSMLGGGFFAYVNMFFPAKAKAAESVKRFDAENDTVRGYFENNIFFEMSHAQPWGKAQLTCAVQTLGADHIVFGTSYPVRREWLTGGADFVRGLDIADDEKELILHKNAERLYGI